ncbi:MAG: ferric reductase [Gemmatimonadetes bacterium]|nr:ferric reductase [Gemmatimonadota bacterium]
MNRIRIIFWVLCLGLTAMWLAADPVVFGVHPFAQLQYPLINYTGILAMGVLSVSLMLALRSVALEPHVGGLDKSYRLHKWLGVAGLVMAIAHWMLIQAPGWLVALGLMPRPARGAAPPRASQGAALMRTLEGPARSVGQLCLYATVILVVLALLRRFPYRYFIKTHRLLAVVFLILVFHSVVLLKTAYWTHAISYVITALMVAASAAAVYILVRKVGRTRQAVGEIEAVTTHQDGRILGVTICLKDRWVPHEAGQFAFVSFDDEEGPHPYTISSTWKGDGRLQFLIKGLGDYTSGLPSTVTRGSLVTVEGPYGQFTFSGTHARQIWISAGIGITPFVSRMQQLAVWRDTKVIDLFHATAARDDQPIAQLRELAATANVRLHVWVSAEEGRLTAAQIRHDLPDWTDADIWFCGPVDFGNDLRKDFVANGLSAGAFHQELFHLR